MAVTMDDVLAVLGSEEPDYARAAAWGAQALPHLAALVRGDDPMLASKAAYAAGRIADAGAAAVVRQAAESHAPHVRVAAAAAAKHLEVPDRLTVLEALADDRHLGVVETVLRSAGGEPSAELRRSTNAATTARAADDILAEGPPALSREQIRQQVYQGLRREAAKAVARLRAAESPPDGPP